MTVRFARPGVAGIVLATLALLAGCSGAGTGAASPGASSSALTSGHSPAPSSSATPAALTCSTMIPDSTVKAFTAAGWTPQEGPFYVGDTRLSDGLLCTWGSADSSGELFGWSPITRAAATTAEKALLAQGWRRLDGNKTVVITAGSGMIVNPDADGYGMSYEFGDGWVKVASTKQSLLLIDGPH